MPNEKVNAQAAPQAEKTAEVAVTPKPKPVPEKNVVKKTEEQIIKEMNLFEKLSAITAEISAVAKNLSVGVGKSSYKAVGEADVLAAVKPAEAKFRVYSYPLKRSIISDGTIESTNYNGEVKKQIFERIETIYRFVNMDKPEEFIDITSYGDGIDTGDKSVGKAMTYSDKYALLKAYKIITGDDPDQNPSETLNGKQTKAVAPAPKKGVSPELAQECKDLGGTLEQIAAKKGMKVEDLTDDIVRPILMAIKKRNAIKKTTGNATPQAEETHITPEVPQGTGPEIANTDDKDWVD